MFLAEQLMTTWKQRKKRFIDLTIITAHPTLYVYDKIISSGEPK